MKNSFFRVSSYVKHQVRSLISRGGYGIHSPFAFNLVRNIINSEEQSYYYCYETIERLRLKLKNSNQSVLNDKGEEEAVKAIAKCSGTPTHDGQLIFRIAVHMQSHTLIELGGSLGLGTAYLASTGRNNKVISIDHNKQIQELAEQNLASIGANNVTFINGTFEDTLEGVINDLETVDLIFFDGNHNPAPTLDYYQKCKGKTHKKSVFIFHDIHWSKGMNNAWKTICQDELVSLSIERYNMGIIFFNKELHKQHFYV